MPQHFESNQDFLVTVETLIDEHYSNPQFSVSQLAQFLMMHRASFTKKVRKLTGDSPIELIEKKRMEIAKELIAETNMPLTQIAFKVGYTELSNFSRAFRRHFNESPSKMRMDFEMHPDNKDATN